LGAGYTTMAIGDKISLVGQRKLARFDFAVSPKNIFAKYFPKLQKVILKKRSSPKIKANFQK